MRARRSDLLRASTLLAASAWAAPGRASPFDVFGFGPDGTAQVSARAARADDGTASFYNPGGLAFGRRYRFEAGSLYQLSLLRAQGKRQRFEQPFGGTLAFDSDVPLEGPLAGALRVGFGGYFLPGSLMRLETRPRSEPFFSYYANRTERLVALPALAVRVTEWLGIGAAANVLAGLSGPAEVKDGPSRALETRVDQEATTTLAANVGVQLRPSASWRFGLVYRQKFASANGVQTASTVGGVPLSVDVDLKEAFFTPDTVVAAASFDVTERLAVEIDAAYLAWSAWRGPLMAIEAQLPGATIRSRSDPDLWRDTWTARAAGTLRLDIGKPNEVVLGLGAGFEPSIQRAVQQGETNMMDGDKLLVGFGARLVLPKLAARPVSFALGLQGQIVGAYSQDKQACTVPKGCTLEQVFGTDGDDPSAGITNPGYPTLRGSGSVWAASLGVGVEL